MADFKSFMSGGFPILINIDLVRVVRPHGENYTALVFDEGHAEVVDGSVGETHNLLRGSQHLKMP